jgi:aminocarboxymuconate-semialdehyde decarboxylase
MKIDMHTHLMPKHLPQWAETFGYGGFIHLEHHRPGFARMMQGTTFFREVAENCWNAEQRIEEYARLGVQKQVVCTIPVLFAYFAKAADGLEVAKFLNDDIADVVKKHPAHYIGLGTLPMQDVDLSVQELARCKEIGLKGVQIGSNINELNLHEPQFYPLWEACERYDMAVMVHPWNMMGEQHIKRYWLPWLVGMPAETSRAMCSMIFGGIFDKFPKLRVCFSHAGGSFFATLGRIEHGFNCRPDLVAIDNPINPRNYLNRFWIDNITHDAATLQFIMTMQNTDKICLGSDYPFPLGDLEMGKFMDSMNLSNTDLENINYKSTLAWLGI